MVVLIHESKRKIAFQYTALILGVVLVSQLGIHDISVGKLATNAYENLANVASMSASIPPNDFNILAAQFSQKENELTQREQDLLAREANLDAKYQEQIAANKRLTLYVLGGMTILLIMLIFLNFYFDIKREEAREKEVGVEHGAVPHDAKFTTEL